LGDMPFVSSKILKSIADCSRQNSADIIVPTHQGRRGHPVVFPAEFFPLLQHCSGDTGAKFLIQENRHRCSFVEVNEPSIHWDVDTIEALQGYAALLKESNDDI